jgi:hypothetical protein
MKGIKIDTSNFEEIKLYDNVLSIIIKSRHSHSFVFLSFSFIRHNRHYIHIDIYINMFIVCLFFVKET